ncbi:hypothetical protein PP301_gp097 [Gordonia phage GMA2]|uniref:Uncharacterized protein n=1 Tax=Gordonia phage GMA2 TaxID=1647283 RepID=A0A0K0N714_9CAUD|nr:hypothetical protein PP301_gp097 [Gordonia phage GMA2]AKJ72625.1 hypothetical protein GMA2_87 [Gordonia phage GMA2]
MTNHKDANDIQMTLSSVQLARSSALREARAVLQAVTPISRVSADASDLIRVAEYIITGQDPWDGPTDDINAESADAYEEWKGEGTPL